MDEWQKRFAKKLETVQSVTRDRFEQMAQETFTPVFKQFSEGIREDVVRATTHLTDFGIRTFRFSMSEDVYLLITFRYTGFERCEARAEYYFPGKNPLPPTHETVSLSDVTAPWCCQMFEQALDQFLDTVIDAMGGADKTAAVETATV